MGLGSRASLASLLVSGSCGQGGGRAQQMAISCASSTVANHTVLLFGVENWISLCIF